MEFTLNPWHLRGDMKCPCKFCFANCTPFVNKYAINCPSNPVATKPRGLLGDKHTYGRDPLEGYEQLQQLRERDFWQMYPNMEEVFQNVVTGNASLFK